MSQYRYGPRFSKRATLASLAGITIGVFGIGMALPYVVGEDPATAVSSGSTTATTIRRRHPVPVAQVVETTTTTASSG